MPPEARGASSPGIAWREATAVHVPLALALGCGVGALVVGLPTELGVSAVIVGITTLVIGIVAARRLDERHKTLLLGLFALAVALRFVMALLLHYFVKDRTLFGGDDVWYEVVGLRLVREWELGEVYRSSTMPAAPYHYWNGVLFYVFGPHKLLPKAVNAVIGACCVFPAHRLARNIFQDDVAAKLTAVGAALLPSLVLWSSMNLRDPIAILTILMLVDAAVALRIRLSFASVLVFVPLLALLGTVRSYMVLVVGLGIGLSLLAVRSRHTTRDFLAGAVAMVAILFTIQYLGFGKEFVRDVSLERVATMRAGLRYGGSAFEEADVSTPLGALTHLPIGLANLMFAPFPWQLRSIRQIFALPEVLLTYAFFPFIVIGLRDTLRTRATIALPAIGVLLTVLVAYALVEGNLGTAYRHKAQVVVLLVAFGAGGFASWRRRRAAARALSAERFVLTTRRAT